MYDQCKYSKCVCVNTNHTNLYMYDQCKYSKCVGLNTNHPYLYKYDQSKYSGCKQQPPKPLHV